MVRCDCVRRVVWFRWLMVVIMTVFYAQAPASASGRFVEAAWLEEHLNEPDVRIIQVGGEKYYPTMHIPGALLLPYSDLVAEKNGVPGMRAEQPHLEQLFSRYGIGPATRVVAYDAAGGMDAARLVWTLATLGHQQAMVLNGGVVAWVNSKRPMTHEVPAVAPMSFQSQPTMDWVLDGDSVLKIAETPTPEAILFDTRSGREYVGMTLRSPRGHIAGAVHMEWTDVLVDPSNNPILKERAELLRMLAAIGISDFDVTVIPYCETAHRASLTWLLLLELGFKSVRLYDGSMAEWRVREFPVVGGSTPR